MGSCSSLTVEGGAGGHKSAPPAAADTADVLVLSSCVQMPSLASVQAAEDRFGLPVFSAATATTYEILDELGLSTQVPGARRLLAGGMNE